MNKRLMPLLLLCTLILMASCGTEKVQESERDPSEGAANYSKLISANNQFGLLAFSNVEEDKNGNKLISPISIFLALSMAYNGADGETKKEMEQALQLKGISENELNKETRSVIAGLHRNSDKVQLNIANSIWLNEDYHFQANFAEKSKKYFKSEIQEFNITDTNAPRKINNWVKKATNRKIEEIVDSPLNPDLAAILINAVYFNGEWAYEFDPKLTENKPFYLKNGTTKVTPFMKRKEKFPYMETEHFQAISLPYGDKKMHMDIFLPKEYSNIGEFEKYLTTESLKKWNSQMEEREGTIELPKFQLEYEIVLNDTLKELGMKEAFDHDEANFSRMIKEKDPVWISSVKQKTFLDVNEKGTEAAAATSIEIITESVPAELPFYMEVNRPFFITITDSETGAILFLGSVSSP